MKKLSLCILLTLLSCVLCSCDHKSSSAALKVGVIAGPESELMDVAKQVAQKRYHLNVEVVVFTDYSMPNEALNAGNIDANMFQHRPYLNAQIAQHGYKIAALGNGFIYPMSIFSKKFKSLSSLPMDAKVGIPNDPSNEARALLLLANQKLITLNNSSSPTLDLSNIKTNPKQIHFTEMDAAQLPRALDDLDAAAITNTYINTANLNVKDAIAREGSDSPYVNVLVVRTADLDKPEYQELLNAFQSEPVIEKAKQLFGEDAIPGFTPTPSPQDQEMDK